MSTQNIYPKPCVYNCGVQIFWNTSTSEYWEVFTKKKHLCPNRVNKPVTVTNKPSQVSNETYESINPTSSTVSRTTTTSNTKPTYYSKKPWNTQPKPKMSNSFELLTGPISEIQKKYEILSDIVIVEHGGKVHGSQSHIVSNNSILLIVYYEVPLGMRDEVKQKFNDLVISTKTR
jgi:hypothetical protein